jgi:arylsulfatase A-like enzyme
MAIGLATGCVAVDDDRDRYHRPATDSDSPVESAPNVLFVLVDDVGIDKVRSYFPQLDGLPTTPTLDRLATEGMRFENAYAQPICSPTRAALMTGRHSRRFGIGRYIPADSTVELSLNETLIPELLADVASESWSTAAFGKWHLSGHSSPSMRDHPNLQGFQHYSGVMGNFGTSDHYFDNTKIVDGDRVPYQEYATTETFNDAIAWISTAAEPWYVHVATQTAHTPLHCPPEDLHNSPAGLDDAGKHAAMVEAFDTEFGRLLDAIDPDVLSRTNVVFMGDNGSYKGVILPPFLTQRSKGTVYEGGARVPLLVVGPAVGQPGSASDALVHVTDWLPTIGEWAGLDRWAVEAAVQAPLDGNSLVKVLADPDASSDTPYLYADHFQPLGPPPYELDERTLRDERWKVVDHSSRGQFLYDLSTSDLDEGEPIPLDALNAEQQAAFDRLMAELDRLEAHLAFEG